MAGTQGTFRTSFNTSHVTLYLRHVYQKWKLKLCFNTSHVTLYLQHVSRIRRENNSFNTSHVTLYPDQREFCISVCMFQYISCYSLSWNGEYKWDGTIRFNTSHVTLYLHPASQSSAHVRVSIHLMLLFIISFSTEFTILKTRFNTSHVTLYRLHE